MENQKIWSRRNFNKLALASTGVLMAPAVLAGVKARVVIIGGGVSGATAARQLASINSGIEITLIEPNARYVTPFFSNRALVGIAPLDAFTHGYGKLNSSAQISVLHDRVVGGDPTKKQVQLESGKTLSYDRLIVAPGTELITDGIKGYGPKTENIFPHAYNGTGPGQWKLLQGQLQTMDNGGLVIITVPERPYRCTPAPYERASLIGDYLKQHKPRSKLLVLDAKNEFPLSDLMLEIWEAKFGENVEWVSADFGGVLESIDTENRALMADGETHKPAVANIIPPQRAGKIATDLGLVDESGWCPIDPLTFESGLHAGVYVLGDAIEGGDMPKSAAAAHSQAVTSAVAISNALSGGTQVIPDLENRCYFLTEKGKALVIGGRYKIGKERIIGIEGYSSDMDEDDATRRKTAETSDQWYRDITQAMFG